MLKHGLQVDTLDHLIGWIILPSVGVNDGDNIEGMQGRCNGDVQRSATYPSSWADTAVMVYGDKLSPDRNKWWTYRRPKLKAIDKGF